MKINLQEIKISEVVKGYINNDEEGVVGYNGLLNIRPKYQREFVYKDKQRDEVIRTIMHDFPLNVMYWVKNNDNTYEVMDGQQRTISICEYVMGNFSIDSDGNPMYYHNLTADQKQQILDYPLMIYFCEGTDKEKLDWFKIINIAGEKLTNQELRNAVYTGVWLTDAKKYMSRGGSQCVAYQLADKYINGAPIRQDFLETALRWIVDNENKEIEDYMAEHQHDLNALPLWLYFQAVIHWVMGIFPNYRKNMKGIEWGLLYNNYKDNSYDPNTLENRIIVLIDDDEVQNDKGIYEYLLSGETQRKLLNLRAFPDKIAKKIYQKQKGICPMCTEESITKTWEFEEMEADHIIPWSKGGKTKEENCQLLCQHHNRTKSGK